MTWPHVRRSCNSGQSAKWQDRSVFHLQGWACSPPCRRVWGATAVLWSGTEHRLSRETPATRFSSALGILQRKQRWLGHVQRFPESEVISAQPASRQANKPICHLHNPAIRTQTPGAGRASHLARAKCCRGKCIQLLSSGDLTNAFKQTSALIFVRKRTHLCPTAGGRLCPTAGVAVALGTLANPCRIPPVPATGAATPSKRAPHAPTAGGGYPGLRPRPEPLSPEHGSLTRAFRDHRRVSDRHARRASSGCIEAKQPR